MVRHDTAPKRKINLRLRKPHKTDGPYCHAHLLRPSREVDSRKFNLRRGFGRSAQIQTEKRLPPAIHGLPF